MLIICVLNNIRMKKRKKLPETPIIQKKSQLSTTSLVCMSAHYIQKTPRKIATIKKKTGNDK